MVNWLDPNADLLCVQDPKRKVLATGSVPTKNLPTKSHEVEHTKQRRVLVRSSIDDELGTSHGTAKLSLEIASANNRVYTNMRRIRTGKPESEISATQSLKNCFRHAKFLPEATE